MWRIRSVPRATCPKPGKYAIAFTPFGSFIGNLPKTLLIEWIHVCRDQTACQELVFIGFASLRDHFPEYIDTMVEFVLMPLWPFLSQGSPFMDCPEGQSTCILRWCCFQRLETNRLNEPSGFWTSATLQGGFPFESRSHVGSKGSATGRRLLASRLVPHAQ